MGDKFRGSLVKVRHDKDQATQFSLDGTGSGDQRGCFGAISLEGGSDFVIRD